MPAGTTPARERSLRAKVPRFLIPENRTLSRQATMGTATGIGSWCWRPNEAADLRGQGVGRFTTMKGSCLNIFCDVALEGAVLRLLERGVAPHKLVLPGRIAPTVLAESEPDPALAGAEIAFGQPDVQGVLGASRLKWLHISSAGYTRYDTPQFRKAAAKRKFSVTNSSSVYAGPCAEQVLAFMLA